MRIASIILFFAALGGCTVPGGNSPASYQISFRPAFSESSRITFSEEKEGALVEFVLFRTNSGDEPLDTSYIISNHITSAEYERMREEVFERIHGASQNRKNGIRDGISMVYSQFHHGDTTIVELRNPQKGVDSPSIAITRNALKHLRKFTSDTSVIKHLLIVEKYMQ